MKRPMSIWIGVCRDVDRDLRLVSWQLEEEQPRLPQLAEGSRRFYHLPVIRVEDDAVHRLKKPKAL